MNPKEIKSVRETFADEYAVNVASGFERMNLDLFKTRMKALVDHFGSIASIAKKCVLAESTVKKWVDGISDPSRGRCIRLARGTGASLLWLVAGEGPMWETEIAQQSHSQPVRQEELTMALQLADEALEDKFLPREKRAELTALIYDMLVEGLPQAKVLRFVRAAKG